MIRLPWSKYRQSFRDLSLKVEAMEKRQRETDGIVDVLLADATYKPDLDYGMNGQRRRKEVVEELFKAIQPDLVIETGTYLGATTGYFATQFGKPVYSSELMPRNYHFSRRLLRQIPDIHLSLADSRSFLNQLAKDSAITSKTTFFYLDAHWYDDLPLADEIDIIAPVWNDFVILIDDFQVPNDAGYEFDDYGPGKDLTMRYLQPVLTRNKLRVFFPVASSGTESGRKRGYAVVCPHHLATTLNHCQTLKAFQ